MSDEVMDTVEGVPAKPTVTRPARSKSAPARRASETKKATPKVVEDTEEIDEEPAPEPIRLTLKPTGETLNYATFQLPRVGDNGKKSVVTGTVYAPKGTRTIKILVI